MFTIDLSENEVLGPMYKRAVDRGEHQGHLAALRRQIERRFGTLPAWVEQKLAQSSIEDLEAVELRVLDAATPEELFG